MSFLEFLKQKFPKESHNQTYRWFRLTHFPCTFNEEKSILHRELPSFGEGKIVEYSINENGLSVERKGAGFVVREYAFVDGSNEEKTANGEKEEEKKILILSLEMEFDQSGKLLEGKSHTWVEEKITDKFAEEFFEDLLVQINNPKKKWMWNKIDRKET